jgi:hypothetical protein
MSATVAQASEAAVVLIGSISPESLLPSKKSVAQISRSPRHAGATPSRLPTLICGRENAVQSCH